MLAQSVGVLQSRLDLTSELVGAIAVPSSGGGTLDIQPKSTACVPPVDDIYEFYRKVRTLVDNPGNSVRIL